MENRFKLLSEADLESSSSKLESTNTKRRTSTWLKVYHAWAKVRNKKSDQTHELDSILCQNFVLYSVLQILIHMINSKSHGFFGQFWENRPSGYLSQIDLKPMRLLILIAKYCPCMFLANELACKTF